MEFELEPQNLAPLKKLRLALGTARAAPTWLRSVLKDALAALRPPAALVDQNSGERAARAHRARLAREGAALVRLHEASSRLWLKRDLRAGLDEMLAGAIELLGADMGNIQIFDPARGVLEIAAHRGFGQDFLDFFREVSVADDSACGRALRSGERVVIEDVEADVAYTPFRAIARAAGYRAVQSTPIIGHEGALLGMLSTHFRSIHWPAEDSLRLLDLYVQQAAGFIERCRADEALRDSEVRLRLAQQAGKIGTFEWNLETGSNTWTPQLEAMHGLAPGAFGQSQPAWEQMVHPKDRAAAAGWVKQALETGEPLEREWRIVWPDNSVHWISGRFQLFRGPAGRPLRLIGVNIDITERKRHEEQLQLLLCEVNHRAKNMLGLVQAIASQTAAPGSAEFIKLFSQRVQGLAASQDLLVKRQWQGVDIEALVRAQLAHFSDLLGRRIKLDGPALQLAASAAQSIGMALHELATNAGKYGALSNSTGEILIRWRIEYGSTERFHLSWAESGGPPVLAPARRGFGTTVIVTALRFELGGDVTLDYLPEGLRWCLECPLERISAS